MRKLPIVLLFTLLFMGLFACRAVAAEIYAPLNITFGQRKEPS